jgi:hypothetical protein
MEGNVERTSAINIQRSDPIDVPISGTQITRRIHDKIYKSEKVFSVVFEYSFLKPSPCPWKVIADEDIVPKTSQPTVFRSGADKKWTAVTSRSAEVTEGLSREETVENVDSTSSDPEHEERDEIWINEHATNTTVGRHISSSGSETSEEPNKNIVDTSANTQTVGIYGLATVPTSSDSEEDNVWIVVNSTTSATMGESASSEESWSQLV